MKRLLLVALLFAASISASAQTPFAKPGSHWCTSYVSFGGIEYGEPWSARDTTVLGIPCSYFYEGAFFVRNDTVFRILRDSSIHFLYDYSAHKGDVWDIRLGITSPGSVMKVHIDSAYVVFVRGQILRVFNTSVLDTPQSNFGYTLGRVVENVGGSYSFLPGPWEINDLYTPLLKCYQDSLAGAFILGYDNGEPYFLDSCVCHRWMGQNEIEAKTQFSIAPNPASNSIVVTVDGRSAGSSLTITDPTGRRVAETVLTTGNTQLSTDALPEGLYFVKVSSYGRTGTQKLLIHK